MSELVYIFISQNLVKKRKGICIGSMCWILDLVIIYVLMNKLSRIHGDISLLYFAIEFSICLLLTKIRMHSSIDYTSWTFFGISPSFCEKWQVFMNRSFSMDKTFIIGLMQNEIVYLKSKFLTNVLMRDNINWNHRFYL